MQTKAKDTRVKHFTLLATALMLPACGPAMANDQLARSPGVEHEGFPTVELVQLKATMNHGKQTRTPSIVEAHPMAESDPNPTRSTGATTARL
ncbi:MAG: hypothetical protein GY717_14285 [Rhodobacteraceae bacterium]|nr:hypothetical protein [Paracoccaceae bacterium]